MRLYELTTLTKDKFTPTLSSNTKELGQGFAMADQKALGSGSFATAFSTKEDPGTVRKVVGPLHSSPAGSDAYFEYVSMLANNDRIMSNPYFPRIFDIQVKQFPGPHSRWPDDREQDMFAYAVDIERLHHFDTLSNEEARMLGNLMFYNFERSGDIPKSRVERPPGDDSKREAIVTRDYTDGLMKVLYDTFDRLNPAKRATTFKDPKLKQAVMLVRKVLNDGRAKDHNFFADIHSENIMIRRGRGIPQLVFNDPVAH